MTTERKERDLPTLVAALRATYEPMSVFWRLQREFGVPAEVSDRTPELRNFLSGFADDLGGNPRFRGVGPKWTPTAGEDLALTAALNDWHLRVERRPIHQLQMFLVHETIRQAVRLGIVMPRAEAVKEELLSAEPRLQDLSESEKA